MKLPSWTKPKHLTSKEDRNDLKKVFQLYKENKVEKLQKHMSNLDTIVRDEIPSKIYKKLKKGTTMKALKGKKGKTILIGGSTLLLGGGLVYFLTKGKKTPKDIILPPTLSTGESVSSLPNGSFPLQLGSKSVLTAKIQQALKNMGGNAAKIIIGSSVSPNGGVDGILGPGTQKALQVAGYTLPITERIYKEILTKSGTTEVSNASNTPSAGSFSSERLDKLALKIRLATSGFMTNEPRIYEVAEEIVSNEEWKALKEHYGVKYHEDMSELLKDELNSSEQTILNNILKRKNASLGAIDSGVLQKKLRAKTSIDVWNKNGNRMPVTPRMILGKEVEIDHENNITSILTTDNVVIFAPTSELVEA